jgi:nucleoside phosphorylase
MDLGPLGAAADEPVMDGAVGAQAWPQPGSGRLGLVTALQTEAHCLRQLPEGSGPLIHVSGGSALRARAGAEGLRQKGVAGLVSFGLAIGLAPVLRPGDVVVADSVVLPDGRSIATHAAWRAALLQRLGGSDLKVRVARIAGNDELPASATAKRRVFQATFAAALDTDGHAVASSDDRA